MNGPKIEPRLERNFLRIFKSSICGELTVSAADRRRLEKLAKPRLIHFIREFADQVHSDNEGRFVVHALRECGHTDRIVYDPSKDTWESNRSAGQGWPGLIARIWNRQDSGSLGGLDVLHVLAGSYGLAALLNWEACSKELASLSESDEAGIE